MAVAAYGSVLNLAQSLRDILPLHGDGRIILDEHQFHSLQNQVQFLQNLLESLPQPPTLEADDLAQEIKAVFVNVEILINKEIVKQLDRKKWSDEEKLSSLTRCLQMVIRKIESMMVGLKVQLVSDLVDKVKFIGGFLRVHPEIEELIQEITIIIVELQLLNVVEVIGQIGDSLLSSFIKALEDLIEKLNYVEKWVMRRVRVKHRVISDEELVNPGEEPELVPEFMAVVISVIGELMSNGSSLRVTAICGMAGTGKTTLARYVFENHLMKEQFEVRMWCTISKDYTEVQILQSLLQDENEQDVHTLEAKLYHYLYGRRYLIVLDDVWSADPWEFLMRFLPENNAESRVIVTTRAPYVGKTLTSSKSISMRLLEKDSSWRILCRKIFKGRDCPIELQRIGRKIASNCSSLPMTLASVGDHLAKSEMTYDYWEKFLENMRTMDCYRNCIKVLSSSYIDMPIHLKLCLLSFDSFYRGVDVQTKMLRRWISDGILKPISGELIEDVAKEYLNDLLSRNFIIVYDSSTDGEVFTCGIQGLLQELCRSELKKENFLSIPRTTYYYGDLCCTCESESMLEEMDISQVLSRKVSTTARCAYIYRRNVSSFVSKAEGTSTLCGFRFPLPTVHLWNLQFLTVMLEVSMLNEYLVFPPEIWEMHQLRHLVTGGVVLPAPETTQGKTPLVLRKLQTLNVYRIWLRKEIVEAIPNLRELDLILFPDDEHDSSSLLLHNVAGFSHLQVLTFRGVLQTNTLFLPCSLKKLVLFCNGISKEHMTTFGSLPNLESLSIYRLIEEEWNTVKGQFLRLRYLLLSGDGIRFGSVESDHFPSLETLSLHQMTGFEIPSSMGYICNLRVNVLASDESTVVSVLQLHDEQQCRGNGTLQVCIDGLFVKGFDNDSNEYLFDIAP